MGTGSPELPQTAWSRLITVRNDPAQRAAAMEYLARHYWKPVYLSIRRGWRKPVEESKDLTQAFFTWAMESDVLSRLDPGRGRFRAFLKVVLRNFLNRDYAAQQAIKRGGSATVLPLEVDPDEDAEFLSDESASPEDALDAAWKTTVLEQAVGRLRDEYRARGKEHAFLVFRDHDLTTGERPDYESLAKRHGVSRVAISDILTGARTALRRVLVEVVSESVTNSQDCRDELRELFGFDEKDPTP